METFCDRLRNVIGDESVSSFARRAALKLSTLTNILVRNSEPAIGRAAQLAEAGGVSLEWLATGRGPMRPSAVLPDALLAENGAVLDLKQLQSLEKGTHAFVRLVHEAGGDPIPADLRATLLPPAAAIANDDEIKEVAVNYANFQPVKVIDVAAAAGGGAEVYDETVTSYLNFKLGWLAQHGLQPSQCSVISVQGDSMAPTLPEGCSILVNLLQRTRRNGHIFVLRTEEGLVVKRLVQNKAGWQLISDNTVDFPPLSWPRSTEIIGEVVWAAMMPK